jgi:hypothetical protein
MKIIRIDGAIKCFSELILQWQKQRKGEAEKQGKNFEYEAQ